MRAVLVCFLFILGVKFATSARRIKLYSMRPAYMLSDRCFNKYMTSGQVSYGVVQAHLQESFAMATPDDVITPFDACAVDVEQEHVTSAVPASAGVRAGGSKRTGLVFGTCDVMTNSSLQVG